MTSPFAALDLPEAADLTDDDVRAAWRRLAAATHPDRGDGGDPARFAAAAAAYAQLRTASGRGEALADGAQPPRRAVRVGLCRSGVARATPDRHSTRAHSSRRTAVRAPSARWVARRAPRLGIRVLAAGWQPASAAIIAGALTWLARAGRPGTR